MRKLLFLTLSILTLISCSKENERDSLNSPTEERKTANLRIYYDNGGNDYGCSGVGGNCLPDVDVCGNCLDSWIQLLLWLVEHQHYPHSIDPGDPNNPNNVYDDLVYMFGQNNADLILNGTATITTKGSNQNNGTIYVIITNLNEEILAVHPYVFD